MWTPCERSHELSGLFAFEVHVGSQCAGKIGVMLWMQVPYGEGVASYTGPESCAATRKGGGEALTGERTGRVMSRENHVQLQAADAVGSGGRPHWTHRQREMHPEPARSETPSTHGNITHGSREAPRPPVGEGPAGRTGKSKDIRR